MKKLLLTFAITAALAAAGLSTMNGNGPIPPCYPQPACPAAR